MEEFDSIMSKWLQEHRLKRESGKVDCKDEDFMDVLLSVLGDFNLAGFDVDTVCKATSMVLKIFKLR
ncbi:hypothetical protein J0J30_23470, partial [Vibrio vulnificus]|nr:hypothetical protein [Vibrio vulnificus]